MQDFTLPTSGLQKEENEKNMIRKRSDLNGKVYGRQNRQMLMPKEKSSQRQHTAQRRLAPVSTINPGIKRRGFRRSPHLQAVMDRIEERRQLDREKEIRWQASSRRRRTRQANNYSDSHWEGDDAERDLSDVLEVFAKYDNMLEHLVLKNMELVSLAEKKNKKIPDDETVLTEKVLKDLRALRQFREQQLEGEPLQDFSELKGEYEISSLRAVGNPYLPFKRPNELQENKAVGGARTASTPMSPSPTSSSCNRKQLVLRDEEIVDTFRPPRKSAATTASAPESRDRLDSNLSRTKHIRELRERQRKRKEAQARKQEGGESKTNKGKLQGNLHRKYQSEIRQFQDIECTTGEEQLPGPRQQVKANKSQIVKNRGIKAKRFDLRVAGHSLEQAENLRKELEEMWCTCPLDLPPESHPRPPRKTRKIDAETDSQTEESDNDSFGPSREARKLKKRLGAIYQQSKNLKNAQEDMRGEMLKLQQGYKQKHNKLKRKFLRNTAPPKEDKYETRDIEHFITAHEPDHFNQYNGGGDDSINYEVRDGVIVLDDIYKEDTDTPECEFLGVRNPQYTPDLSGGKNYMNGPNMHVLGEKHGHTEQVFVQQPVMELPFFPEEQAQYLDAEWNYDPQGVVDPQSHSHNRYMGRDEDDTDDDETLSYDTQPGYTEEHYHTRREPVWNCSAER